MSRKNRDEEEDSNIKTPLWKWLVFILIVLSMPVLYLTYGTQQTEEAVIQSEQ